MSLPGECISMSKMWYASSACDIATDAMIILLPISQLPRLRLPKVQKLALGALFCIGILCVFLYNNEQSTRLTLCTASSQLPFPE
jgi:hypothetical protein